jgi:hypothetical protein
MSFDYSVSAAAASRMLSRFGRSLTLVRTVTAAYDPETGSASQHDIRYTGTGVTLAYATREIDETTIRAGDQRLLLSVDNVPQPKEGDLIELDSDSYRVIRCESVAPAGVEVLYRVQLRGVAS